MKNNASKYLNWKRSVKLICLITIFTAFYNISFAQSVTVDQNLSFGTFCPSGSSGGTVTIDINGNRTSSGNIILFSSTFSEAVLTFHSSNRNKTVYSITKSSQITLSRIGGGGTMKLTLGTPSTTYFYVRKYQTKSFSIGGTLTVGSIAANPGGNYSGTFHLTCNYY